jgi:transposase-like protein
MKLICPRCGAGNRIGSQTRYQTFDCSSCGLLFFGLEAHTSWGSFLLDDPSKTPCPHCWQYVRLMADLQNGGWHGPPRCSSCRKKLPKRPEYSWQQREAQSEQVQRELQEEQEGNGTSE